MKKTATTGLWVSALAASALVCAPTVWAVSHFESHALPGTSVAGVAVGGQNRGEVAQTVQRMFVDGSVRVDGPGGLVETGFDSLGVAVDADAVVEEVFQHSQSVPTLARSFFKGAEVEVQFSVDGAQVEQFLSSEQFQADMDSWNEALAFDDEQGRFVVDPTVSVKEVDVEAFKEDLEVALAAGADTVPVQFVAADSAALDDVAALATDLVQKDVQVLAGDQPVVATASEKSGWVRFKVGSQGIEPVLDEEAVTAWVAGLAQTTATPGRAAVVNSTEGTTKEIDPGVPGEAPDNVEIVVQEILLGVSSGQDVQTEFTFAEVAPSQLTFSLDEASAAAYDAAPGEKWIDVDIAGAMITAYEGDRAVMVLPTVPGARTTPTKEGVHRVYAKIDLQDMSGLEPDGTPWHYTDVPYVLYYDGDYAIHGSWWRNNFGEFESESGSHGCPNLAPPTAKLLYEWADYGTVVVARNAPQ